MSMPEQPPRKRDGDEGGPKLAPRGHHEERSWQRDELASPLREQYEETLGHITKVEAELADHTRQIERLNVQQRLSGKLSKEPGIDEEALERAKQFDNEVSAQLVTLRTELAFLEEQRKGLTAQKEELEHELNGTGPDVRSNAA